MVRFVSQFGTTASLSRSATENQIRPAPMIL